MKRGFTLVELLVVISVVSMLASIVMVRISLAQADARDATRTQQIHQVDLATKLYVENYKKTPPLHITGCDVLSQNTPTEAQASACFAVSTAAADSTQAKNWIYFKDALKDFIQVPDDPCVGTCISSSAFPIGYTYVAPLAMQYYCSLPGNNCTATSESYQVYAPMERQTVPSGSNGSSELYYRAGPSVSAPTGLTVTYDGTSATFSFDASVTTYQSGIKYYRLYEYENGNYRKLSTKVSVNNLSDTRSKSTWEEILGSTAPFCLTVVAIVKDDVSNQEISSDYATPYCVTEQEWSNQTVVPPPPPQDPPPTNPPPQDSPPPSSSVSVPTNLTLTYIVDYGYPSVTLSWDSSVTTYPGNTVVEYMLAKYDNATGQYIDLRFLRKEDIEFVDNIVKVTKRVSAWRSGYDLIAPVCWSIRAWDNFKNKSDYATPNCIQEWQHPWENY